MNSSDVQSAQQHSRHDHDLQSVIRQLTWSIVTRCLVAGVVMFFAALEMTRLPWGMGGPDYLFAALVGCAAAGLVGLLAGSLVFLNMQLAKVTGAQITESRRFGLWLHRQFARQESP